MRTISAAEISDAVRALCIGSNRILPDDMRRGLAAAQKDELWPTAAGVLDDIIENYRRAERLEMPVCQDTGMACVFVELGQEVHIDGSLEEAIQEGVRRGYLDGYLRKSVVSDPIERINTLDNTPAVITYDVVMGDRLTITVAPKGAGSENMGRLAMLKPSDGLAGVKRFVLDAVEAAGPNPCPPIVVGVGIGGNFDRVALLAKRALLRPIDRRNPNPVYAALETELLDSINALGIGPQGFGGRATALGVNIEVFATHIAQLPCAVNIGCHVTRHQTAVL
ncbi:MAG: fumarate hydratase [Oscillospiraceae bacterium]|nr:fumarate hydratase [Oscillospiraceae bacterium]MDY3218796.1 fumarate hydratase [Candidatus Fimivivens sp.]SFJ22038.1 fumarate hydratase subunit alpha [Ruminococcaceae bacterium D5]